MQLASWQTASSVLLVAVGSQGCAASEGQAKDFHPSNEIQLLELSEDSDDSLGIHNACVKSVR